MFKQVSLLIMTFLLVTCSQRSVLHSGGQNQTDSHGHSDSVSVEYTVSIKRSSNILLNKTLYGMNQPYPQKAISIREMSNLPEIASLNIALLRFPGGTLGNYYRWSFDGYEVSDLDKYPVHDTPYRREVFSTYGKGGKKVGFPDYVNWLKRDRIDGLFVLNVCTEPDPGHIVSALNYAKSEGVKVRYCELGNELFYPGVRGDKFRTVQDYISRVKPLIRRLKAAFPEVKLAVPISEDGSWDKGVAWNEGIANTDIEIDAYVIHPYLRFSGPAESYLKSEISEFTQRIFPAMLKRLGTQFPGKKIWITEWNILDAPSYSLCKTLMGTIFAADFFCQILRNTSIEVACYHRLEGQTHGIIEISRGKSDFDVKKDYSYFFWEMVGHIFSDCNETSTPQLHRKGNEEIESTNSVDAQAFFGDSASYVLVINKSNNPRLVCLNIDGKAVSSGTVRTITGPSLGHELNFGNETLSLCNDEFQDKLIVPPISVSLLIIPHLPGSFDLRIDGTSKNRES